MEFLNILTIINLVVGCLNLLILIGLAGTVAKMLQYLAGTEEPNEEAMPTNNRQLLDLPTGQLYHDESGRLVERGPATYADLRVFSGEGEPNYDGVTNRPSATNWDGIPQ